MPTASFDVRAARLALLELRQLEREVVELELLRRSDALQGVQEALHRIGEVGSPEGILDRAAEELGAASRFDRVLISQIDGRTLIPYSLWSRDPGGLGSGVEERLRALSIPLEYPLIEAEVASRPDARSVDVEASGPRSPGSLRELMGWRSYVVAALTLRGSTIGLLHAEPPAGSEPADALDREVAALYASGLAGAFERAALRETLQRHREELRAAVTWMSDHLRESDQPELGPAPAAEPPAESETEALTPRETEVLGLLGRGRTNAAIATSLLISESTVKFHVKNILLKLGATSRADAVARHLRGGG